jgi:PAS domain S-box-containing protein
MTTATIVELTILTLVLALIAAAIDRRRLARTAMVRALSSHADELAKSEQQYRLLFEDNPSAMWVYDESTREFLAVNEAAIRRYGYTREEFLSMSKQDLRVEEAKHTAESLASGAIPGHDPAWNGQHRKKDGTLIDVVVTSNAITFDGHRACLALALDVTDPKRAEEALRQSEQRTRMIIDTALDAVVSMDSCGIITDWGAQAERMFGWPRAEAMGQRMSDTIIPQRYRDAHNRGLKKFLRRGGLFEQSIR